MSTLLSTATVDRRERLAYWVDMVCDTYVELECESAQGCDTIEGEISSATLASLQLTTVTATPQKVRRTSARIARASQDYLLVSIQTRGEGRVLQDGREAHLRPGDFALYDSTRPYELQFDGEFQQYVLMMPGPLLRSSLRNIEALTATSVSSERGAGQLMVGMIHTLARDADMLAPASATAVADGVISIVIAGLSTLPVARQQSISQLVGYHREQIKACVRAHLREPSMSVGTIAALLRLSPSTLYRVWAGEPCTLAEWIWIQRLGATRRDLSDPTLAGCGISEIAYSWGFNDAAHFSRAFRARFGCTPREYRAQQHVRGVEDKDTGAI